MLLALSFSPVTPETLSDDKRSTRKIPSFIVFAQAFNASSRLCLRYSNPNRLFCALRDPRQITGVSQNAIRIYG